MYDKPYELILLLFNKELKTPQVQEKKANEEPRK